MIVRKSISSSAAATLVSLAAVATANANGYLTRTVKAWDLDLAKPADVQTLYERVQAAASDVCRAETRRHWRETRARPPLGWRERCVNETVDSAVREIAHPRLAALHGQGPEAARRLL